MSLETIENLRARLRTGFGRIVVGNATIDMGDHAQATIRPTPAESRNLQLFLGRLTNEFEFDSKYDRLELTYEDNRLTLARLSFTA